LGEAFNPKSDMHVRHLLFGILRLPPQGLTDSGLPSVDEEALSYLLNKCDLISPLLEFRKWNKALSTYIGQIERETVDGILRPFFGLHNVATYRSNSNSPNFQNQPKRDKEVMSSIRSCFIPRKGHKLIEYDYKACEVSIAAAVSGDPELIRYVSDPTSDMHKDASVSMYFLEPERVNKTLRNVTKGPFIFAEFYGSYYAQTALGMWSELDIPVEKAIKVFGLDIMAHLVSHGINDYSDWEQHVKEQERILWEERFPIYQEFRERTYEEFIKKGYIDYVDGFRYYGPGTKNELLNAPVQGPAFHTQLWTFKSMDREIESRKMNTRLIGQIHDSILADVDPAEEVFFDNLMWQYGTQKVREHFDWITVPLMMEKSTTEIDKPWSTMREIGMLKGE
jgi:DNA polymerase-1